MVIDILLGIFSFILALGFCTGDLDWVLIYYGCAPKSKKDKINGKRVLGVATLGMNIVGIGFVLSIIGKLFWELNILITIGRVVSIVAFILMLGETIYECLKVK